MNVLMVTCALALVAVSCRTDSYQSNRYPAGVHPSLCPHYPYCDNVALALSQGSGYHESGYPAHLSPQSCPNYPYCSHEIPPEAIHYRRNTAYAGSYSAPHHIRVPLPYTPKFVATKHLGMNLQVQTKYPAGLDPASCPNYPFCH